MDPKIIVKSAVTGEILYKGSNELGALRAVDKYKDKSTSYILDRGEHEDKITVAKFYSHGQPYTKESFSISRGMLEELLKEFN